jgi:hypothetical protein
LSQLDGVRRNTTAVFSLPTRCLRLAGSQPNDSLRHPPHSPPADEAVTVTSVVAQHDEPPPCKFMQHRSAALPPPLLCYTSTRLPHWLRVIVTPEAALLPLSSSAALAAKRVTAIFRTTSSCLTDVTQAATSPLPPLASPQAAPPHSPPLAPPVPLLPAPSSLPPSCVASSRFAARRATVSFVRNGTAALVVAQSALPRPPAASPPALPVPPLLTSPPSCSASPTPPPVAAPLPLD